MDQIAVVRERINRLSAHLDIDDLDPEIDVQRLGEEPLKAIYAAIQELKLATLDLLWAQIEQEEDRLRALGVDPDAETEGRDNAT